MVSVVVEALLLAFIGAMAGAALAWLFFATASRFGLESNLALDSPAPRGWHANC